MSFSQTKIASGANTTDAHRLRVELVRTFQIGSGICWTLVYLLIIKRGFQDQTFGMLLPASLAVAWAQTRWPGPLVSATGWLFIIGTVLFSGSLYLLSLTGMRWLGAVTPLGGLAFLGGWLCLALAMWRA